MAQGLRQTPAGPLRPQGWAGGCKARPAHPSPRLAAFSPLPAAALGEGRGGEGAPKWGEWRRQFGSVSREALGAPGQSGGPGSLVLPWGQTGGRGRGEQGGWGRGAHPGPREGQDEEGKSRAGASWEPQP